jgi:predicted nucleic acid-binding protein
MSARSFLDSNVLICTDDAGAKAKQATALTLVEQCQARRTGVLSTQVLQEYFVITTRKLGVDVLLARQKVELFSRLTLVATGVDDVLAAIDLHRLHGISFWDALIVRSALAAGCTRLYSEDLQNGRRIDGLEIVNPFR